MERQHDESIRLLLADDQEMVRTGFRMVLDAQPDMSVVAEASNGAEAVQLATDLSPDVVLMDGLAATERVVSHTNSRVLVLTTFDIDEYVHRALRAGASGFLLKDAGPADLLAGVRTVHQGNGVVAPSATRRLIEKFRDDGFGSSSDPSIVAALSEREVEVLTCVGRGLTNAEIAEELYLAETTVKTHISHILTKLDLRDRVHMVITAYNAGLVQPSQDLD